MEENKIMILKEEKSQRLELLFIFTIVILKNNCNNTTVTRIQDQLTYIALRPIVLRWILSQYKPSLFSYWQYLFYLDHGFCEACHAPHQSIKFPTFIQPLTQILILQTIAKPISGKIKEQARQCVFILSLVSSMVILTAKHRADMNVFEVFAWTLPNLCIAPKWDYEPTYLENLPGIYVLYPKLSPLLCFFSLLITLPIFDPH